MVGPTEADGTVGDPIGHCSLTGPLLAKHPRIKQAEMPHAPRGAGKVEGTRPRASDSHLMNTTGD